MSTTDPYHKLKSLLDQYIQLFQELEQTETGKVQAAESYDIEQLDRCMKEEQAFILKMRGFEKRRRDLFQILGVSSDVCLTELLPRLPDNRQQQFEAQFAVLKSSFESFHAIYQKAVKILTKNGRIVDEELNRLKKLTPGIPYTASGARGKLQTKSITNLQI